MQDGFAQGRLRFSKAPCNLSVLSWNQISATLRLSNPAGSPQPSWPDWRRLKSFRDRFHSPLYPPNDGGVESM